MRRDRCLALAILAAVAAPRAATAADVAIEPGKTHIDFRAGKELVARYIIDAKAAKPYFWPLNAPSGLAVTRPWPMEEAEDEAHDHVHQKSAWFCHGDVIPEGMELKHKVRGVEGVDFWSEAKGHGQIVCTRVGPVTADKGHAQVTTWNEWRTAGGKKVLDEKRTIHLYDLGAGRLLVLEIDLHASAVPVTFGDTKEGALGVRVRESLRVDRGKGKLTNAEGKSGEGALNNVARTGCWGLVSAWCDYSGPVGAKVAGVAIFADPKNPVPTAWHSRDYGLMAANPFGRRRASFPDTRGKKELVRLPKGGHLKLRYGIFLHRGDAKEAKVAELYQQFVKQNAAGAGR